MKLSNNKEYVKGIIKIKISTFFVKVCLLKYVC